jgi:hypothetical protein
MHSTTKKEQQQQQQQQQQKTIKQKQHTHEKVFGKVGKHIVLSIVFPFDITEPSSL